VVLRTAKNAAHLGARQTKALPEREEEKENERNTRARE
jgi:hypothetical protein